MRTYEKIDELEEQLIELLGVEELLNALTRAMSYDEKEDYFNYICRMYDVDVEE